MVKTILRTSETSNHSSQGGAGQEVDRCSVALVDTKNVHTYQIDQKINKVLPEVAISIGEDIWQLASEAAATADTLVILNRDLSELSRFGSHFQYFLKYNAVCLTLLDFFIRYEIKCERSHIANFGKKK